MRLKHLIIPSIAVLLFVKSTEAQTVQPKEVVQRDYAKHKLTVAVIDTGIADSLRYSPMICKYGNQDFTGTGLTDHHGHGTHIAGLIDQNVKNKFVSNTAVTPLPSSIANIEANYCIVVLKYYDPKFKGDNMKAMSKAIRRAIDLNVDYINISGGGTDDSKSEKALIEEALNKGITLVFAAGNEHSDTDIHPYYPASYDKRIIVVGNESQHHSRLPSSNWGSNVKYWEVGENAISYGEGNTTAMMTGTSQATAIKTGKLIRERLSH